MPFKSGNTWSKRFRRRTVVTYTSSGSTSIRVARERPESSILSITPDLNVARKLALVWGVHSIYLENRKNITKFDDITGEVREIIIKEKFAEKGQEIVISAVVPFGVKGNANLLMILAK